MSEMRIAAKAGCHYRSFPLSPAHSARAIARTNDRVPVHPTKEPMTDRAPAGPSPDRPSVTAVRDAAEAILAELERAIVGKREPLKLLLAGMLADGHLLLEDNPGLAKTLAARSLATVCGLKFSRIQFTPDLLPSDVTGSAMLDRTTGQLRFQPGPLFAQVVLADEVNRTPPKTQAALLEAMQERQVTLDGTSHPLGAPFIVIATQNPIEHEGTYPLPEAQLDRFMLRISLGYPNADDEWQVLARRLERQSENVALRPMLDADGLLVLRAAVEEVHVSEPVGRYVVDIVRATRKHPQVEVGASPRGALALMAVSRALAALDGRDFVRPDDVKQAARPTLGHRLVLRSEAWVRRVRGDDIVAAVLESVPAPVSARE